MSRLKQAVTETVSDYFAVGTNGRRVLTVIGTILSGIFVSAVIIISSIMISMWAIPQSLGWQPIVSLIIAIVEWALMYFLCDVYEKYKKIPPHLSERETPLWK